MNRNVASVALAAGVLAAATPILAAASPTGSPRIAPEPANARDSTPVHTIIDSLGRRVTIPTNLTRIADTGAVPVLNSMLFMFGGGNKLVNGLPSSLRFAESVEALFVPRFGKLPTIEGQIGAVNTEALAFLNPQVVFTDIPSEIGPLQNAGFKVVALTWQTQAQLKSSVTLLGQIFNQRAKASKYIGYLNGVVKLVRTDTARISVKNRPRVIYLQYVPIQEAAGAQIHWWGQNVGLVNVAQATDAKSSPSYSAEQILAWNPGTMFVQAPSDARSFEKDPRFTSLAAVKSRRVYVIPQGLQHWGNTTSETPLVMLWTAKLLHPQQTANINIRTATKSFYRTFFGKTLSNSQISYFLNSGSSPTPG